MSSLPGVDEVTKIVMNLNSNKAPGPDGFSPGFYKAAWNIIGSDLISAICSFFNTSFLPQSANNTIFALVPKFPGASLISDFRPISCCNTPYKIVSKLLVSRLKPMLHSVILPNQRAFIKGRLLIENTVLAAQVVHGYHLKKGSKRITVKVDIAKAFDSVRWDFILGCLRSLDVPNVFLRWIEACICTPTFSIGYNGSIHGYFKGKRGLRQGDPLSPYLFVLAMNCLSILLNRAAEEGKTGYHPKCKKTKLTHLCFADDLLIFIDGSMRSVQNVLKTLDEFKEKSGLAVSLHKTSFFTAGLTQSEINIIKHTTGLTHSELPVRYLGVPLCTKKLSMANCAPLFQKIKSRIGSWSAKTLSFAGRLQLLNSVIAGVTNFWCSSFILPKQCTTLINSLCGAFLWKGSLEGHYSARVAWDTVTLAKDEGGLGLRELRVWNTACALKFLWMLFFKSGSLWVAWFTNEILNGDVSSIWRLKEKQSFSWLVKKLLRLRDIIYPWIKLKVGNGISCSFWFDNWSHLGSLTKYLEGERAGNLGIPHDASLASLYISGTWLIPPARSENQVHIQMALSTINLIGEEDTYEWFIEGVKSLTFSTGQVYKLLKDHKPKVDWTGIVWFSGGIPRQKFLTWLFTLNRCPTRDRLSKWGLRTPTACVLCNDGDESRDHLLFRCDFSFNLWNTLAQRTGFQASRSWDANLTSLQVLPMRGARRTLTLLLWQSSIYALWTERNNRIHRGEHKQLDSLLRAIDSQTRAKIQSFRIERGRLASAMIQIWFGSA